MPPDVEFVVWSIVDGISQHKEDAEGRIAELINCGWWPINTFSASGANTIYVITLLALPPEISLEANTDG